MDVLKWSGPRLWCVDKNGVSPPKWLSDGLIDNKTPREFSHSSTRRAGRQPCYFVRPLINNEIGTRRILLFILFSPHFSTSLTPAAPPHAPRTNRITYPDVCFLKPTPTGGNRYFSQQPHRRSPNTSRFKKSIGLIILRGQVSTHSGPVFLPSRSPT